MSDKKESEQLKLENGRLRALLKQCFDWCNDVGGFATMYGALKEEFEPDQPTNKSDDA